MNPKSLNILKFKKKGVGWGRLLSSFGLARSSREVVGPLVFKICTKPAIYSMRLYAFMFPNATGISCLVAILKPQQ